MKQIAVCAMLVLAFAGMSGCKGGKAEGAVKTSPEAAVYDSPPIPQVQPPPEQGSGAARAESAIEQARRQAASSRQFPSSEQGASRPAASESVRPSPSPEEAAPRQSPSQGEQTRQQPTSRAGTPAGAVQTAAAARQTQPAGQTRNQPAARQAAPARQPQLPTQQTRRQAAPRAAATAFQAPSAAGQYGDIFQNQSAGAAFGFGTTGGLSGGGASAYNLPEGLDWVTAASIGLGVYSADGSVQEADDFGLGGIYPASIMPDYEESGGFFLDYLNSPEGIAAFEQYGASPEESAGAIP